MPDIRKIHFCIFCKKKIKRVYQHLIRKHNDEEKVRQIRAIQDRRKRFWEWKVLTHQGDYLCTKSGDIPGEYVLVKKASVLPLNRRYYTCSKCFARIRTISKNKHDGKCSAHVQISENGDEHLDLLDRFPENLVKDVRRSPHLNDFIQNFFEEKGKLDKRCLRTAITDLLDLEQSLQPSVKDTRKYLVDYFSAEEVDNVIRSVKCLAHEYTEGGNLVFRYPWKVLRICRVLKKFCKFVISTNYKRNNDSLALQQGKFLTLFEHSCEKLITPRAYKTIKLKERKNPRRIPTTSNITEVVKYLQSETPKLIQTLKENKLERDWRMLAENLLCRITIYNRRRGGAVEKMTVKQFTSRSLTPLTLTEETLYNMTEEEKEFLNSVKIIDIIHKCDNLVPIYITNDVEEAMSVMLEYRKYANVNPNNEHFFAATKKSVNPIKCARVMEKYRKILPKNIQKIFTATALRKHGATTSKVLDLTSEDMENWAAHMGHTLIIQKKYYRLKENVETVLRTGRILKALDEGTLKYFKGKKLKDIPLTPFKGTEMTEENITTSSPEAPLHQPDQVIDQPDQVIQ